MALGTDRSGPSSLSRALTSVGAVTEGDAQAVVPALEPGDVYLYAHDNGAIYVLGSDGRSQLSPLAEALSVVGGCHAAGHRVMAARDDGSIAAAVLEQIGERGVPVVPFAPARPPHSWDSGTDALIEAAAVGSDHILDDLIERGADVHHRDDSGSTALHHAAAHGNLHAIDALVAAGADRDAPNLDGFTPLGLALATRETAGAQRLTDLGARSAASEGTVVFGRGHSGTLYWRLLAPLAMLVTAGAFLWPLSIVDALVLAAALTGYVLLAPPLAFWAGGAPRRLDGPVLTLAGLFGRSRRVDLEAVTAAAIGGSSSRSSALGARWLVLAHPAGQRVSRRGLRRLAIPTDELDDVAGAVERAVVVTLDGVHRDEVIRTVGNLLSSRGVDLSTSLRRQLTAARGAPDRPTQP